MYITIIKSKPKKNHTVGKVPEFNRKIVETKVNSIPLNTHICWIGTVKPTHVVTSIK